MTSLLDGCQRFLQQGSLLQDSSYQLTYSTLVKYLAAGDQSARPSSSVLYQPVPCTKTPSLCHHLLLIMQNESYKLERVNLLVVCGIEFCVTGLPGISYHTVRRSVKRTVVLT